MFTVTAIQRRPKHKLSADELASCFAAAARSQANLIHVVERDRSGTSWSSALAVWKTVAAARSALPALRAAIPSEIYDVTVSEESIPACKPSFKASIIMLFITPFLNRSVMLVVR